MSITENHISRRMKKSWEKIKVAIESRDEKNQEIVDIVNFRTTLIQDRDKQEIR